MGLLSIVKDFAGLVIIVVDGKSLRRLPLEGDNQKIGFKGGRTPISTIGIVMPAIDNFSGGATSVFKFADELQKRGTEVTFLTFDRSQTPEELRAVAAKLHPPLSAKFASFDKIDGLDLGIATSWQTAYALQANKHKFGTGAYFILDFEAGFYPLSHRFWMAFETYKMGFINLTLGPWIKKMIQNFDPDIPVKALTFPVDLRNYPVTAPRIYSGEGPFKICVYLKKSFRRGGALVWESLRLIKARLGDKVDIEVFGLLPFACPLPFGRHCGKLNAVQLRSLYAQSHLGIVASFSNVSLVPFEMIATGLPVMDFESSTSRDFFEDRSLILTPASPEAVAEAVVTAIANPQGLGEMVTRAQQGLAEKNWALVAAEFLDAVSEKRLDNGSE